MAISKLQTLTYKLHDTTPKIWSIMIHRMWCLVWFCRWTFETHLSYHDAASCRICSLPRYMSDQDFGREHSVLTLSIDINHHHRRSSPIPTHVLCNMTSDLQLSTRLGVAMVTGRDNIGNVVLRLAKMNVPKVTGLNFGLTVGNLPWALMMAMY